ncbi:dol-P-Man:Man(5)GlcNAc(2)-PP-Dol alpha-1,3-mannosyltransferase [Pistacia vera]|uniref:dol-P-Man:Man(5)GlcNAc(2)-PP-Dol alpha-1,3-mannosyltransferase n=1 Tax=Pistacia vera TaxID=55513 RepID=UPI0012635E7B|nr:dol-P-Man:Man(5)GlcNAc(2)-PP-Dol alpha-1,3-mannosyltransferase [Pistacia vera]
MAGGSTTRVKHDASSLKIFRNPKIAFAFGLILADALLVALIIKYVPYTKIDWDAYMAQVSGFLGGERDYKNLKGDTGPLVYPAGFLYLYSAIQYITGGKVYSAQILFGVLYFINLAIILFIYVKTNVLPWWALSLLCLSKRVHSIFVLRLFNDCFAMTLLHAAIALLLYQRWNLGLIVFSTAVSIKMNVLLYAPPLLLLLLKAMSIGGVISALAGAALMQILLGLPFIASHPIAYISRSFNLGRVFIHFWSVNFKFIPEPLFVSKGFAVSLLIAHLVLLVAFAHYRWCKTEGGLFNFLHSKYVSLKLKFALSSSSSSSFRILKKEYIVTTMFVGNFIGIVCARSLHYQFYSWYFYSLPYLLWKTSFHTLLRLILFIGVELCWNVYPSNIYSSFLLLCLHLIILWGLWSAPPEYPYVEDKPSSRKNK